MDAKGENTYRLDMPPDPPANLFWSVTLYDAETAGGLDAESQEYSSLNSMNDPDYNPDGSVTFYFGPHPPAGAKNWLKTVPGRSWFSLFRFYGPEQEFFDGRYQQGDFVNRRTGGWLCAGVGRDGGQVVGAAEVVLSPHRRADRRCGQLPAKGRLPGRPPAP